MRPPPGLASGLIAVAALHAACAQLSETRQLRVEVLEPARTVRVALGTGLAVRGVRSDAGVRAQVDRVARCAQEQQQRALGIEVVERRTLGASMWLQWVFGGVFAAAGGFLVTTPAESAAPTSGDGEVTAPRSQSLRVTGAVIGLAGLGLLGAAIAQTASLGIHERVLGERVLRRQGPAVACGTAPAPAVTVRLTLPDGTQLEAMTGLDGHATVPLPADVSEIVTREGTARATLEALGDATAQVRIDL